MLRFSYALYQSCVLFISIAILTDAATSLQNRLHIIQHQQTAMVLQILNEYC